MIDQNEFIKKINELTELAEEQGSVIYKDQLFELFPEIKEKEEALKVWS